MKRIRSIAAALFLSAVLLSGCSAKSSETEKAAESTFASTTASTVSTKDTADMFTDRDKDITYSESESTAIKLADSASTSDGKGVEIKGNTITITAEGTYILSGSLSDGQIVVDASSDAKIQLVLKNAYIRNLNSAAISIVKANKVFLTTADGSDNKLSVTGEYAGTDDSKIDAVIFSKSDLTLNGAGTLTISASYGHGVVSKDDLAVTSGTYVITAAENGLVGKNSVRIADGVLTISAGKDGIHSENNDDTTKGFVYIEGGTINLSAGKQGVQGDLSVTVAGGKIDITKSYEGIEGPIINIKDGEVSIVSSDDGMNAAVCYTESGTKTDTMANNQNLSINISGGTLSINANGDGIDSNGNLTISGGNISVSGPTENNNGTLDYNGTATISGGTLLGAGSSGMTVQFDSSSTQGSILYVLSGTQQAGTQVTLKDASGNVVAQFTPAKQFQSVNISASGIKSGSSYTLSVGSQDYTIDMSAITYSNSSGRGMGGGQGGGPGGGQSGGPGERGQTAKS